MENKRWEYDFNPEKNHNESGKAKIMSFLLANLLCDSDIKGRVNTTHFTDSF